MNYALQTLWHDRSRYLPFFFFVAFFFTKSPPPAIAQ